MKNGQEVVVMQMMDKKEPAGTVLSMTQKPRELYCMMPRNDEDYCQ